MDILTRVLRVFAGLLTVFAGYFLMAAEGWGEPLEHMFVERVLAGGFIILIGFWFVLSAFLSPAPLPEDDPPESARAEPPAGWVDSEPSQDQSRLIVHPLSKTQRRLALVPAAESPPVEGDQTPGALAAQALLMAAEHCDLNRPIANTRS